MVPVKKVFLGIFTGPNILFLGQKIFWQQFVAGPTFQKNV
jgi:hypothetical protein